MTAPPPKPLPVIDPGSRPFWQASAQHRLAIQRCRRCRTWRWPPCGVCANCHSWDTEWERLPGDGVVASYAVVHRSFYAAFANDVPYVVGLITLAGTDDQVVMLSNVIGCDPAAVRVGMPVRVAFDELAEGVALPKFSLITGAP